MRNLVTLTCAYVDCFVPSSLDLFSAGAKTIQQVKTFFLHLTFSQGLSREILSSNCNSATEDF